MIDVTPQELAVIKQILKTHVPLCQVKAFGSRVTDTAKDYSDLDLVVTGESKIDRGILVRLKEAFEESKLPFRVDVLDGHAVSEGFKNVIESGCEIIQEGNP